MSIFVIGRQRSGTTVFRSFLSSNARFADVGEILHNRFLRGQARASDEMFYRYLHDLLPANPEWLHPGHHLRLLGEFLRQLEEKYAGRYVVADVKYNLLYMITRSDVYGRNRPALFEILKADNHPVVHIARRNKLRLIVSEKLANATGQWSAPVGGAAPVKATVSIKADHIADVIKREIEAENHIANLFRQLPRVATLYYEDLFDEGAHFAPAVGLEIGKLLSEELEFSLAPKLVKQNPESLEQIIENYGEVRSKLTGTPFEWMLQAP